MTTKVKNRQGLTLLELVVVMVILVALAGIIVPLLPSMVSRAHTAAHATNVVETNKAVESYNMLNRGYPDNLDSLATAGALYANLPGTGTAGVLTQPATGWTNSCGGELVASTLTAGRLAALNNAGITTVWTPDTTTGGTQDLLNNPYGTATAGTPLTATSDIAVLSAAAAQRLYNEPTTGSTAVYVVLGFGSKANIVGHGVAEAPVHFSDDPGDLGNPTLTYGRFALVFRVTNTAGRDLEVAQFVGAVAFHPDHVSSGDAAIAEYNALNH